MWLTEAALHAEWLKQKKTLKDHCTPTQEFCQESRERSQQLTQSQVMSQPHFLAHEGFSRLIYIIQLQTHASSQCDYNDTYMYMYMSAI